MLQSLATMAILGIATVTRFSSAFVLPTNPNLALTPARRPALDVHDVTVSDRSRVVTMAVPKKRTSKMKTRQRKANWYAA